MYHFPSWEQGRVTTEGWGRRETGVDGQEGWESESGCLLRAGPGLWWRSQFGKGMINHVWNFQGSKCVWFPPTDWHWGLGGGVGLCGRESATEDQGNGP